jgi:hypothetical protein
LELIQRAQAVGTKMQRERDYIEALALAEGVFLGGPIAAR